MDRAIELGIADPDRLAVMGHSYGGYSTLALITQTRRFKAAVFERGAVNLTSVYGQLDVSGISVTLGWSETGQGNMGSPPWEVPMRYIQNSPLFFLDRVETPLLIIQGAIDPAVHRDQADATFVGLRRLGKEVEYANYAGEGHWEGAWSLPNALDYWARVIRWFDSHLSQ